MEEPKAVLPGALVAAPTFNKHVFIIRENHRGAREERNALLPGAPVAAPITVIFVTPVRGGAWIRGRSGCCSAVRPPPCWRGFLSRRVDAVTQGQSHAPWR